MKNALFIIAHQGFRDEELFEPRQILEEAGFMCDIASNIDGICTGKLGAQATTTVSLHTIDIADYDVLILVGGPGARELSDDFLVADIIKEAYEKEKIIAAICIAPTILAKFGLLKGKEATVHDSGKAILLEQGVNIIDHNVVVDSSEENHIFITANGPDAAVEFGETIAKIS